MAFDDAARSAIHFDDLALPRLHRPPKGGRGRALGTLGVVVGRRLFERLAHERLELEPRLHAGSRVRIHDPRVTGRRGLLIEDEDPERQSLCQPGEATFALGEQASGLTLLRHVVEDEHHAGDLALGVPQGRRILRDRALGPVLPDEHLPARRGRERGLVPEDALEGVLALVSRVVGDGAEDLGQGLPERAVAPARELLGGGVHAHDATRCVGGDHSVTDGAEQHREALLARSRGSLGLGATPVLSTHAGEREEEDDDAHAGAQYVRQLRVGGAPSRLPLAPHE